MIMVIYNDGELQCAWKHTCSWITVQIVLCPRRNYLLITGLRIEPTALKPRYPLKSQTVKVKVEKKDITNVGLSRSSTIFYHLTMNDWYDKIYFIWLI